MERFKALAEKYGPIAFAVYFGLFVVVLAGFAIAIRAGFAPEGIAGTTGVLAAAWVATKLTQLLRIAATIVLTPFVARLVDAIRGKKPTDPNTPSS